MPGDDTSKPPDVKRLTNRDRVPPKKATAARLKPTLSEPSLAGSDPVPVLRSAGAQPLTSGGTLTRDDLGSGRGYLVEWEVFVDQLFRQLEAVGGSIPLPFVHDQPVAAAVWTITHHLGTRPTVVVVDGLGQQLLPEVHYPDDQTAVVVHGVPYAGTAYLRA